MTVELFHYIHCPFCLRVRFALGYLGIPFKSNVVSYDDEKTPVELTGVKMLPIIKSGNTVMNESLDIIQFLDKENKLSTTQYISNERFNSLNERLNLISSPLHSLAMPYWIYTAEFTPTAREYFQKKKEQKRGPFRELLKKQVIYLKDLTEKLAPLENEILDFYQGNEFTLYDILIASHLWGMYVVPEFQFSPKMHDYLQRVKNICHFNYHEDFGSMV